MTITARYAGRCSKCGGAIAVGQEIEWDKETKKTSHAACPAKTATTQVTPKAEAPKVSTELAPIERVFTGRSRHDGPKVGYTFHLRDGQMLTVVRVTSRFINQDEVDDQDDFEGGGGNPFWRFWADCRLATDLEAAPVLAREAAAKAQVETQAEAKRQAELADAEAAKKATELVAGLTDAGGCFDLTGLVETGEREAVAGWHKGTYNCTLARLTLDGEACYLETAHGFDDYRQTFYGPRAIVERAWRTWATGNDITREKAEEWLKSYSACYGHEAYEFAAKS